MDNERQSRTPGRSSTAGTTTAAESGRSAPAPGKHTLTEQLPAAGSGAALPSEARGRLETGFGASLGDVRVHTGETSAAAASNLGAAAFATGQDVHFATGAYEPHSSKGFSLLAHEVAHTVQAQGTSGTAPLCASPDVAPGDAAVEREADAAASSVARGIPHPVSRGTAPAHRVHAFKPAEHADLGNESGASEIRLDDGTVISFGEAIAVVDYIGGSAAAIQEMAKSADGSNKIRWVLWFSNVRGGSEPALAADQKQAIRNNWYKELTKNEDHFGAKAIDAYETHHLGALTTAYLAGFECRTMDAARLEEAVAQHYLNDLFAAGHIRTPRTEIKDWYQEHFPTSGVRLRRFMASSIADNIKQGDALLTVVDNTTGYIASRVESTIIAKAGAVLETVSLGDIVGGAYHDEDNQGLDVMSDCDPAGNVVSGGYKWHAIGDEKLGSPEGATTKQMAVAAMKASLAELDAIEKQGVKDAWGPAKSPTAVRIAASAAAAMFAPFKAKRFIPRVDPAKPAKERKWKWNELDPEFKTALDTYMKGRIFWQLVGQAGAIDENQTVTGGKVIHPRAAYQKFCDDVHSRGYDLLHEAIGDSGGKGGIPLPLMPLLGGLL